MLSLRWFSVSLAQVFLLPLPVSLISFMLFLVAVVVRFLRTFSKLKMSQRENERECDGNSHSTSAKQPNLLQAKGRGKNICGNDRDAPHLTSALPHWHSSSISSFLRLVLSFLCCFTFTFHVRTQDTRFAFAKLFYTYILWQLRDALRAVPPHPRFTWCFSFSAMSSQR